MLIQETINEPDTLLKLFVDLDDQLLVLQPQLHSQQLPRDPRGGAPQLRTAEVLTMLIFGAWLGLTDKAKLYFTSSSITWRSFRLTALQQVCRRHQSRRARGGRLVETATASEPRGATRSSAGLARFDTRTSLQGGARQAAPHLQTARAQIAQRQRLLDGFKLHAQCDQRGRLCAVRLTAANVDDRHLLDPLSDWIETGIIVGDRGYISQERARELGRRGIHLYTPNRKNMKKLATPFQVACLQARHRIEECFEFLKCCFGMIRSTHRAEHAFALHLLVCLLAYSLYNSLFQ